jgi:NTE family protein
VIAARVWLGLAALVAATFAIAPEAWAQAGPGAARPRVGLVLGGGGARGAAHLGVLEALEELRVPFDCVAGTSMGALVGGAYASGVSPAEIREAIRRTDWTAMFDDSVGRESVSLRRKQIDDRFYSGLEFGVTAEGLRYREGAVAGEKIKLFFNEVVRADLGERNIEELPLPLTLMATDIASGERVAMREGNLTTAMRASMSFPGAIAPVVRNGRKLVDGGLVDNLPIQEVRERCGAQVVIAVNVGSPLLKAEEVTGVFTVLGQMVNLLTEQNVVKSLSLLKSTDIYLRPELGDFSAADFVHQLDAAEIGRKAALGALDKLRALSVPPAEYTAWRSRVRLVPPASPPVIHSVEVGPTRFVNPKDLRDGIRQQDGQPLDAKALAEDLVLIYSRGDLQGLDYSVLTERDKTIVRITPFEKPWGPDYLRFGLNLSYDFRVESEYNLRALYRKTWINSYGAEWLTAFQMGSNSTVSTDFYQPVDYRQRFFVEPQASYSQRKIGLYFDGRRLADYRLREGRFAMDTGANLGVYGQARVGWLERRLLTTLDTGETVFPSTTVMVGGLASSLALDTQDFAFFPTTGYKVDIRTFDAGRVSSGPGRYGRVEGRIAAAWSPSDLIFLGSLSGGQATRGTLPLTDVFSLGGPNRLSAYAPGQILGGDGYGLATLQAQYRLTKPMPILGLSLLAGVSYEVGRMKNPITEPNLTGRLDSYGAYVASNTLFGPAYLGYSTTKDRAGRFYLFIGTP